MSSKAIARLASKLLAVYVCIQAINFLQMTTFQLASLENGTFSFWGKVGIIAGSMVPIILYILVGGVLWFFSDQVANHLISEEQIREDAKPTTTSIEVIALASIGVFACVLALPSLTTIFFNYWLVNRNQPNQILDAFSKVRLYSGLVQLIVGIALVLGSKGLVGVLNTLREAGIKKDSHD